MSLSLGDLGHGVLASESRARAKMRAYLDNSPGSSMLQVAEAAILAISAGQAFIEASPKQAERNG